MKLVTGEEAEILLDLGEHPVAHKFLKQKNSPEQCWPIKLGLGKTSGLIGLINPPHWRELTPVYSWIVYNEPEDHLDDLANVVYPMLPENGKILGLSNKDVSLLKRLHSLSNETTEVSIFHSGLHNTAEFCGVEAAQAAFCQQPHAELVDLIVARHILEHTSDTRKFLHNALASLKDDGLLMFEVPDNEKAFGNGQHTIIWEEHSLYFTEASLCNLLDSYGLQVEKFLRYPMELEDILVVVVRKSAMDVQKVNRVSDEELALIKSFSAQFGDFRDFFRNRLLSLRKQYGAVVILGAGHLGMAFVSFYQLAEYIDAVIDDDPNKQGMYMPGSRLPIIGSVALNRGAYSCCLLTCNPWNNEKVAERNSGFIKSGGVFLSIFDRKAWV